VPLRGLSALTSLNLSSTQVTDLEPLKGLTALTSLNLSNTHAANVEPLRDLTALTSLNLSSTQVVSLVALQNLPTVRFDDAYATLPESVTNEERNRFAAYRAKKGLPQAFRQ
jgi:Leucine-rich repeat (LRR) protein